VVGETNDVVRVMNYDMYYVGGRGIAAIAARPDCEGMGPTSTTPWAANSMAWWARPFLDYPYKICNTDPRPAPKY